MLATDIERFLTLWRQPTYTLHAMSGRRGQPPITRQFSDPAEAAAWASQMNDSGMRLYFTANASKRIASGKGFAEDIEGVMCVPADFDVDTDIRPVTEEELGKVRAVAERYRSYCEQLGFGRPALIASGNGYYPLIRFDESVEPSKVGDLMKRWEDHYQERFKTADVKMDSVANLDRILGLPGTSKNKLEGLDSYTKERPNRVVSVLDWGEPTAWERFEGFASALPPVTTARDDIELGEVELPPDLKLPEDVGYVLAWDDYAKEEFEEDESSAEMAVAARLARDGYDPNIIYTLLRAGSIRQPDDPKRDRIDYYRLTIGKAVASSREARAIRDAMAMERDRAVAEARKRLSLPEEARRPAKVPFEGVRNALKTAKDAGVGLGKRDTRAIQELAELDRLTRKEAERGLSVLRKYKAQLMPEGIDIEKVSIADADGEAPTPREIANALLTEYHFVTVTDNEELLLYDPGAGIYTTDAELVIAGEVRRLMNEAMDDDSLAQAVAETIKWVKWDNKNYRDRERFDSDRDRLVVANGILNWRTKTLEPFSPDFLARVHLPVLFNKDAKCPRIDKFVGEVVAEKDVRTMFEIAGYPLSPGYQIQTAIVLIGEGANGKSTWLEVLRALYGGANCTAVSVQHLNDNNFAPAQLYGRMANIVGDLPSKKMATTGKFKEAVGGDPMYAEHKNKQPFSFINRAKFIFSCNQLPDSDDDTSAYWRRWVLVKFPNTFDNTVARKRDELVSEMTTDEEMSGLLNKALDALGPLLDRGYFSNDALTFAEKKQQGKRMANNVYAFWEDRIVRDDSGEVGKRDLYLHYVTHCNTVLKVSPLRDSIFYQRVRELLGTDYQESRPREGDKRRLIITGFSLRPNGKTPDRTPDQTPDQNGRDPPGGAAAPVCKQPDAENGAANATSQQTPESGQGTPDRPLTTGVNEGVGQGYDIISGSRESLIRTNEIGSTKREILGPLTGGVPGTMHFDIEALGLDPDDPANRVRLVVGRYGGQSRFFGPLPLPVSDEAEGRLLDDFDEWVSTLGFADEGDNPSLKVMGWNSHGYDIPLLKARFRAHGRAWGSTNLSICLSIDAMQAHELLAKKHEASYTLENVAQHRLGRGKTGGGWRPDLTGDELRSYCENDVMLVEELDRKFGYSLLVDNVVRLTGCDPFKWLMPPNATDGNPYRETVPIFALCKKRGIELRWPDDRERARRKELDQSRRNTGGFRYAKEGAYRNVLGLDVTSMYPNLIVSFNMGRETFCAGADEGEIRAAVGSFTTRVESSIAKVVSDIMARERELKALAKSDPANAQNYLAEREALKVMRNAVYGIFYPHWSPMYKQEIGANITLLGQAVVNEAKAYLERKYGAEIVFMHTDSVYATVPQAAGDAAVVDDLNAHITEWLRETYRTPDPRIAFESKGIWPLFLLKDMGRYAYIDERGKLNMVGYEKGNFSELKRRLQRHVVESVAAGAATIDLSGFEWPDEDAVTFVKVGLTTRNTAQSKAYKALAAAGMAPSPGLPVGFVVLKKRRVYWNQETRRWIDDRGASGDGGFLSDEERRWVFAETLKHIDPFGAALVYGDGQTKLDIPKPPPKE